MSQERITTSNQIAAFLGGNFDEHTGLIYLKNSSWYVTVWSDGSFEVESSLKQLYPKTATDFRNQLIEKINSFLKTKQP